MKQSHTSITYESLVSMSRESFGEHVRNVVGGFDFLHIDLLGLEEVAVTVCLTDFQTMGALFFRKM
jgi:hypothetical protein